MKKQFLAQQISEALKSFKELFSKSLPKEVAPAGSIGVDIGSYAVKVVRLETSVKDHIAVLGYAVEKVDDRNYREALSRALTKAKAPADSKGVVAVSGQGVVSRYIELPTMNKAELDSSMKFEIEKYVPFSLTEVTSDYAVIREMRDKAKISVLISAAKNEVLQKKIKWAQGVNLGLKAIDLDVLALANFYTGIVGVPKTGACVSIINLGRTVSNMNILCDDQPLLSRDVFIGGDDITKKLSEVFEIDYPEAERLKTEPPAAKEKELMAVWDPVLNNLASEIRVSLDYFESRNNKAVEKIFITGGTSRLLNVEAYLSHALGIETQKLYFKGRLKLDVSVSAPDFEKDGDMLAVALGLALR